MSTRMAEGEVPLIQRPKTGSRLSELYLQNLQQQQAASAQQWVRRPIVVREIVVAVMGATGAGKSSFIRRVTSEETIVVGNGLRSVTQKVQPFKCQYDGKHYSIVDTPGFNDTNRSDKEILDELASWLFQSYQDNLKISGIIYLHSISVPKMAGSALRNLRMFRKLCGDDFMKNVILGTTFWDTIDEETAVAREKELLETEGFFKEMKDEGCDVVRISENSDKCLELLPRFAAKQPSVMQIQQELLDGKSVDETEAASAVSQELAELQRQNNEVFASTEKRLRGISTKLELERTYTLQLEKRAHDVRMEKMDAQQKELRTEIERNEASGREQVASISRTSALQRQGFQVQLDQLSDTLSKMKSSGRD